MSLQKQIQDLQRRLNDQARVKDAGPDLNVTAIPATAEALAARRYHGVEPDYDEETLPDDMDISLRGRANVSYASSAGTASVRSRLNASIDPQTVQGLKEALDHAVERAANAAKVAISRKQGRDAKAEVAHALESIGTAMEASSHSLHPLYADLPSSSSDDSFVNEDELVPQWLSAPAAEAVPKMDGEIPRMCYEPLSDSESDNEAPTKGQRGNKEGAVREQPEDNAVTTMRPGWDKKGARRTEEKEERRGSEISGSSHREAESPAVRAGERESANL